MGFERGVAVRARRQCQRRRKHMPSGRQPGGEETSRNYARYLRFFFFSSRRRHTRLQGDWSSDVCSSDLAATVDTGSTIVYDSFRGNDGPLTTHTPEVDRVERPWVVSQASVAVRGGRRA